MLSAQIDPSNELRSPCVRLKHQNHFQIEPPLHTQAHTSTHTHAHIIIAIIIGGGVWHAVQTSGGTVY